MGACVSYDDHPHSFGQPANASQLEKERVDARLHPLQNGGTSEETLPRDVMLTRTWNSVVCGEYVKGQNVCYVESNMTVIQVVQLMEKKHVDYVVVRRKIGGDAQKDKADGTSSLSTPTSAALAVAPLSPHPPSPTTSSASAPADSSTTATSPPKPEKDNSKYEYLGFFDWRDLDALLVLACRKNQLEQMNNNNLNNIEEKERQNDKDKDKETKENNDNNNDTDSKNNMVTPITPTPLISVNPPPASTSSLLSTTTIPLNSSPSITNTIMNTFTTSSTQHERLDPFLHFLDIKHSPIELVMNLSNRNPLIHVNVASPLLGGAQLLVGSSGQVIDSGADKKKKKNQLVPVVNTRPELYRIAVVNKNKELVGALAHMDCIRFISSRLNQLGDECGKSLHELGLGQKRVMNISWKAPVVSAVFIMHEKALSGLAITDDEKGTLVGSISVSDFKYLFAAPELLLTLQRAVSAFVWAIRQSPSHWHVNLNSGTAPATARSTVHTVTPRTTLKEAISILVEKKIRRLWVVNDNGQPIGLLGMKDILHYLLPTQKSKIDDKKKKIQMGTK